MEINFCARCGQAMEQREAYGKVRPVCPSCSHVHFEDPKVAAAVLVEQDRKILLTRRANTPRKGLWVTPGGFVDADEDPALAAARECQEETGLTVEIVELLDVIAGREWTSGASFVIFYRAQVVGGTLIAGDDASEAAFFSLDELPEIAFESTRLMLERWKRLGQ
ncbi:MAG: NUDIX domain-containing protein [Chloroflexi bacterium]|nr:NUDIX domain-containing protein [Chloroflexota bacterium]